jgi:D-serine deaminase-like pyridoxal phosphate-dependent protein
MCIVCTLSDILYGVPLCPSKLDRALALHGKLPGFKVRVVCGGGG